MAGTHPRWDNRRVEVVGLSADHGAVVVHARRLGPDPTRVPQSHRRAAAPGRAAGATQCARHLHPGGATWHRTGQHHGAGSARSRAPHLPCVRAVGLGCVPFSRVPDPPPLPGTHDQHDVVGPPVGRAELGKRSGQARSTFLCEPADTPTCPADTRGHASRCPRSVAESHKRRRRHLMPVRRATHPPLACLLR